MGKKFFVAFTSKDDERELTDTVRRMNNVASHYSNVAIVVSTEPGNFNDREGFWVNGVGNCDKDSCYSILNHRFLTESKENKNGVYFYDEDEEVDKLQKNKKLTKAI